MWFEIPLCPELVVHQDYFLIPFLLLLGTVLVNYVVIRWVVIHFNWEHQPKTWIRHWSDVFHTFCLTILFYSTGTFIGSPILFISIPANLAFSFIGRYSPTSLASIGSWKPLDYLIYIVGLMFIIGSFSYHVFLSIQENIILGYAISFFIVNLMYVISYLITLKNENVRFHPHHYFIFLCLLFFIRFKDGISQICGGICLGIFVNGTSVYKIGSPFYS